MSFKPALFALVAALAFAGAAQARDVTGIAKLDAPVVQKVKVVADHAVWLCEGNSCTAAISQGATVKGCQDLAGKVGSLSLYGPENKPLSASEIASCNALAHATLQAAK